MGSLLLRVGFSAKLPAILVNRRVTLIKFALLKNVYVCVVLESFDEDGLVLESHKEQEGMFTVKTSLPWKTAVFKNILNVSDVLYLLYICIYIYTSLQIVCAEKIFHLKVFLVKIFIFSHRIWQCWM